MNGWYASPYTGLFRRFGPVPVQAADPTVPLYSGEPAPWSGASVSEAGGIGWEREQAEAACVGEAIERLQAYPLPDDQFLEASFAAWPLSEPAVPPSAWILFHDEQYQSPNFPFRRLTAETCCRWVCCRRATDGGPCWVPEELVFLSLPPGACNRCCPGVSTGLASGPADAPLVLRGLQEVIERDAVVGAWWERYPLEEYRAADVFAHLGAQAAERCQRPNLTYRFLRVASPYSDGVTLVTLEGDDREGYLFSIGSACRTALLESWHKSLLEAIHGRHYVRYLKKEVAAGRLQVSHTPTSFAQHAVYYSVHPERLARTVLHRPRPLQSFVLGEADREAALPLHEMIERLGPERPVLFRSMTPPPLAAEGLGWHVVRVLVPGLQPLHGHHAWAHLGGPLWSPRGLQEWSQQPAHPFP